MRALALIPLFLMAACSDNAAADQAAKAEAETEALALQPGQWETTTEITRVTSQDHGTPVMKVADKSTVSSCVGASEGRKPAPAVLGGMESCSYENIYMSRGRVTAALSCEKKGLSGKVLVSSEGQYKADSFETAANIQTYLPGDGDVTAAAKISGRRTGACTAPVKA